MPTTTAFQMFSPEKTLPTKAPASPPIFLPRSPPFFLSAASLLLPAASPSFLAAPPIAARSPAPMAVARAVAAVARSCSPLAPASLASFSTAGRSSAEVAAKPPSVAHRNFGISGLTPASTSTMIRNPSHTASQSSVLSSVDPPLESAIAHSSPTRIPAALGPPIRVRHPCPPGKHHLHCDRCVDLRFDITSVRPALAAPRAAAAAIASLPRLRPRPFRGSRLPPCGRRAGSPGAGRLPALRRRRGRAEVALPVGLHELPEPLSDRPQVLLLAVHEVHRSHEPEALDGHPRQHAGGAFGLHGET